MLTADALLLYFYNCLNAYRVRYLPNPMGSNSMAIFRLYYHSSSVGLIEKETSRTFPIQPGTIHSLGALSQTVCSL